MATTPHRHVDHGGLELDTRETAAGRGIEVYNFGHHLQPAQPPVYYPTLPEVSAPWSPDTRQSFPAPNTKDPHPHEEASPGLASSKTCGIPSKRLWVYAGALVTTVVIALAVGLGISFGRGRGGSGAGQQSLSGAATVHNMSIAALHWLDVDNVSQYRVFFQPANQTKVLQSASSSADQNWTISTITSANSEARTGTPLAAVAGYINTDINYLHELVFYTSSSNAVTQRVFQEENTLWYNQDIGDGYVTTNASSLFAYRYQDMDARLDWFFMLFQDFGANALSIMRYKNENGTTTVTFVESQKQISVQDGASLAAAPAGSGKDVYFYVGATDGYLAQYPYNFDTDVVGDVETTEYPIDPHTPICVSIQDNTQYYTNDTLPECTQTDANPFLTHLILFASQDRKNLTLLSWNCSSGFTSAQNRVASLLPEKSERRYLGLSAAANSNMSLTGQRVYVAYDEGSGPVVEEWQVPDSGGSGTLDVAAHEANWTSLGNVLLDGS